MHRATTSTCIVDREISDASDAMVAETVPSGSWEIAMTGVVYLLSMSELIRGSR